MSLSKIIRNFQFYVIISTIVQMLLLKGHLSGSQIIFNQPL